MARKQTRRSISLKGLTYQRLKNHCEAKGRSISGYLEEIVAARLDAEGVPVPDKLEPAAKKPREPEEIISQHFTF